jgi:cellulose synthase/poly-beta-1,6-N-acetylglucosamine synthase-like glycosyltransferase
VHLKDCIESLLIAGKGQAQLIFVDDGSTDNSRKILASYSDRIEVLQGDGKGPGRARNMGLNAVKRDYVAFTDADCVVAPDCLEKLLQALRSAPDSVVSVGGAQKVAAKAPPLERFLARFLESLGFVSDYIHASSEIQPVRHNPTCNVLYRKSALDQAQGFDEQLWPCEDLELDLRLNDLGYRALFHPGAIVEHRRPRTFRSFFRMMRRYGFGHAQLVKKRGRCQPLHFVAWIVPPGVLLWICLSILCPTWGMAIAGGGLFLLVMVLALRSSLLHALPFAILLPISVLFWLVGFYSGAKGERRIAR